MLAIRSFLSQSSSFSGLYVCGSPGTGKSLTVGAVCEAWVAEQRGKKGGGGVDLVKVNAMGLTSQTQIFTHVVGALTSVHSIFLFLYIQ